MKRFRPFRLHTTVGFVFRVCVCLSAGSVGITSVHADEQAQVHETLLARDLLKAKLDNPAQPSACCMPLTPLDAARSQAQVGYITLFTSQRGSWPFEFIAHTGVFSLIADHQPVHPRAVQVSGGSTTLSDLNRRIGNPDVIRPFRDGYLLSYPVIVASNAQLDITDTTLYLSGSAGALIINRGNMIVRNATVRSWQAESASGQADDFRPFILGWAGSRMWIKDSQLSDLGYRAHLSSGVTLARHESQVGGPDAELTTAGSRFERLAVPVTATRARLAIRDTEFSEGLLNELHVVDSQLLLHGSHFSGTTIGGSAESTIRIQGNSHVSIRNNRIRHARKAAIELTDVIGDVSIIDNRIEHTDGDGLLISLSAAQEAPMLIKGNLIQYSQRSAIDATGPGFLLLAGNILADSQRYALSYRSQSLESPSKMVLLDNHLAGGGEALIRTRRISTLGLYGNRLTLAAYQSQIFAGDSAPFQAALMRNLARQECDLELIRTPVKTTLMAYPVTADAKDCRGELVSSGYW